MPPVKGLRGVLDNIVSDGMRMAVEVRRKMDEAQREMERNAVPRDTKDEDEEDEEVEAAADRDLLEGAEVASIRTMGSGTRDSHDEGLGGTGSTTVTGEMGMGIQRRTSETLEKTLEFDS